MINSQFFLVIKAENSDIGSALAGVVHDVQRERKMKVMIQLLLDSKCSGAFRKVNVSTCDLPMQIAALLKIVLFSAG